MKNMIYNKSKEYIKKIHLYTYIIKYIYIYIIY